MAGEPGEWEESVIFVELNGVPSGQLFPADGASNQKAKILGLASDRPVMEINGHSFAGHYEDTLGTNLFMEKKQKDKSSTGGDATKSSANDATFEYFCKVEKKLVMQPAFLLDKTSEEAAEPSAETTASMPDQQQGT